MKSKAMCGPLEWLGGVWCSAGGFKANWIEAARLNHLRPPEEAATRPSRRTTARAAHPSRLATLAPQDDEFDISVPIQLQIWPRASILRAQLVDLGVARQIVGALAIDRIHHDALAVLERGLADEGAHCRLMVDLAEADLAERRRQRQSFRRGDQLLRIAGVGLGENRRG